MTHILLVARKRPDLWLGGDEIERIAVSRKQRLTKTPDKIIEERLGWKIYKWALWLDASEAQSDKDTIKESKNKA